MILLRVHILCTVQILETSKFAPEIARRTVPKEILLKISAKDFLETNEASCKAQSKFHILLCRNKYFRNEEILRGRHVQCGRGQMLKPYRTPYVS
jgi:hypothetical protein